MYESRFGLRCRPFPATPDSSLYYPATGHETVLKALARGLAEDEGFLACTGAPGSGKTLLGQCLLEQLGDGVDSAYLANSHCADRAALLQAILFDLGMPHDGGEQTLRLRLTERLLDNAASRKRTLLIVDEAQHLDADLLEELRLLGNLEAGEGKAFQVVLLGLPGFLDLLALPELAAFKQRLIVKPQLAPLGMEESLDFLMHHLRWAGGQPEKIIDEPALEVLARGAQGIPRLLNQAGHQALALADAAELSIVDAEAALETLAILGLDAVGTDQLDDAPVRLVQAA